MQVMLLREKKMFFKSCMSVSEETYFTIIITFFLQSLKEGIYLTKSQIDGSISVHLQSERLEVLSVI